MAVVTGGSSSVPPAQSAQAAPSDAPVQSNASTQSVASPHGVASTRSVVSSQSSSLAQSVPAATIGSTTVSITTSYSSEIPPTQTASATVKPNTSGTVITSLDTTGRPSSAPFNSSVILTSTISDLITASTTLAPATTTPTAATSSNIFVAIATDAPPPQINSIAGHPVSRLGINDPDNTPLETNKFYANFFLGDQSQPTWTHPYSLAWSKGRGVAASWGLSVSHIEQRQLTYGPGDPARFFVNPLGIQSIILSATELGSSTVLTTDSLQGFSANVNLAPTYKAEPILSFPLVQGMGFVTGEYIEATPLVQSGVFFRTLTYVGLINNAATFKYRILLEDNTNWLLYVTPLGAVGAPPFSLVNSSRIEGPQAFTGTVQVAKNPGSNDAETIYDASAGTYAVNGTISGSVNNAAARPSKRSATTATGSYSLRWGKAGVMGQKLLMFALPHHVESFDNATAAGKTDILLQTTTKGVATAVVADQFTMVEDNLPVDMGFAPWSPSLGSVKSLSDAAVAAINDAAATELNEDMHGQTNLDSMYFSGKGLAKFAAIVFVTNDLAKNSSLAAAGLAKLKDAFNVFVNNTQINPLVYDPTWKGVISAAGLRGDSGADFGNTWYNDHHFHYGYFVYTAAVIAYLDPDWLTKGTNKAWVDLLVRDYANPSSTDPYFPFSRSFDWYHGHSWAKGLYASGDGKDQESTSEDGFATYAVKMWGQATGNPNMAARGNLQLAVQARSYDSYFLLRRANAAQPARFVGNKVTGILFENKVDHTTYFGGNTEFVQGIHMLPLNPSSALTRTQKFVQEEWDAYFADRAYLDSIKGGWKGILYANLALIDPKRSYAFFAAQDFDVSFLDGGASRTWYLAYAAGLGGA